MFKRGPSVVAYCSVVEYLVAEYDMPTDLIVATSYMPSQDLFERPCITAICIVSIIAGTVRHLELTKDGDRRGFGAFVVLLWLFALFFREHRFPNLADYAATAIYLAAAYGLELVMMKSDHRWNRPAGCVLGFVSGVLIAMNGTATYLRLGYLQPRTVAETAMIVGLILGLATTYVLAARTNHAPPGAGSTSPKDG